MLSDHFLGRLTASCTLSLLVAGAAWAQCTPAGNGGAVSVALRSAPFAYTELVPALTAQQIAALPDLPEIDEEIPRREHAYVSTALATLLGIFPHAPAGAITVNPDWRQPNPQIRVWIETPASFSNFKEYKNGANVFRNCKSAAAFTIVGVIAHPEARIWVRQREDATDKDSGEYKLFASDNATAGGTRVMAVASFPDAGGDGALDGVVARVFTTPVSATTAKVGGSTSVTNHSCEPDADGSFVETSIRANDNRIALLVPHGDAIETKTSDQITPFKTVLEGAPYSIPMNLWQGRGRWGDDQTSKRWHITSSNLNPASFPGFASMLNQPQFDPIGGWTFQRALSFHGFSSNGLELIVGGAATRDDKCLLVDHVQDELEAQGLGRQTLAIAVRDDLQGDLDIPSQSGQHVNTDGLDGDSAANIVNRFAAQGGIQLEQSKGLRDSVGLREAVARGAAKAMGDLLTGTSSANACAPYLF